MTIQELINALSKFDPCYDIKICTNTGADDVNITHLDSGDDDYEIIIYHE